MDVHLSDDGGGVPRPGNHTDLTLSQELGIILILLLTSKGAAGVTGSGFIVLAATPASAWHNPGRKHRPDSRNRSLHVGARALTNLIGNGLATVVVAKWEGALDEKRLHQRLNQETDLEADEPELVCKVEDDVAERRVSHSRFGCDPNLKRADTYVRTT